MLCGQKKLCVCVEFMRGRRRPCIRETLRKNEDIVWSGRRAGCGIGTHTHTRCEVRQDLHSSVKRNQQEWRSSNLLYEANKNSWRELLLLLRDLYRDDGFSSEVPQCRLCLRDTPSRMQFGRPKTEKHCGK